MSTPDGSLFLTELIIPFDLAVRYLRVRDAYDWHQRVWEVFPGHDGQARSFLFRVDAKDQGYRILLLSPYESKRPKWCPDDSFRSKLIPPNFFEAQDFRFSLLANPTKRNNGDRHRVPLTNREALVAWLQRKASNGGFSIKLDSLQTIPKGRAYFIRDGQAGLHAAVEFRGHLTVTNPDTFRETFRTGIGSAKSFGFGLLALDPLN